MSLSALPLPSNTDDITGEEGVDVSVVSPGVGEGAEVLLDLTAVVEGEGANDCVSLLEADEYGAGSATSPVLT